LTKKKREEEGEGEGDKEGDKENADVVRRGPIQ